jgi:hypothetical protein
MTEEEAALLARKTWRTLEPLHGMIYFAPEAAQAYAELGVKGTRGYFASRSAPMGAVSAEVVIATFYNFNPELVHAAIPSVWEITTPEALITARFKAVDAACRRVLGDEAVGSSEMARAAELARVIAENVSGYIEGRPLCAGHVTLEWPKEPHLVLWHSQSILREYRGDAHVALLLTHGLSGIDALITHAAAGDVPSSILQSSRGWSDDQWATAIASMCERGWVSEDTFALTEWGVSQRQEIEDDTDRLSSAPYADLGEDGCAELRTLVRPWSKSFSELLFR